MKNSACSTISGEGTISSDVTHLREGTFFRRGPIEVEDLRKALGETSWTVGETTRVQWEESWFDGEDWPLFKAGLGLRLKKDGKGQDFVVEMGPVPRSPFGYCHEWHASFNCPGCRELPLDDLASVLEREFSLSWPKEIQERVSVIVYQTKFELSRDGGQKGQMILSSLQATIGHSEEFANLQYNLSSSDEEDSLALSTLCERFEFLPLKRSLLDELLAAFDQKGRPLKKPPRPIVKKQDSLADVAQKVFAYHFERMVENEVGTKVGLDIEYLHDMRVSTRRMRSAFGDFGSCYDEDEVDFFVAELRWVADFLGLVRDLDVQMEDLDEIRHELPNIDDRSFDKIFSMLEFKRQRAREEMLNELASPRYETFRSKFKTFIDENPVRQLRAIGATVSPSTNAKEAGRELLALRTQKVFKRGKKASRQLCDESLHRLRIQCKRLRYLAEFFRSALDKEAATSFIEQLVALQDLIGAQHDSVIACQRLHETAEMIGENTETAATLQQLVKASRERAEKLRQEVPQAFATFKEFVKSDQWQSVLQGV